MSARIAPDSIGAVAALAVDYRPPTPPPAPQIAPAGGAAGSSGARSSTTDGPRSDTRQASDPVREARVAAEKAPPPPLPPETPGADYVRAVISGQLSPRPTSAQELFTRVGTGWTPPESEYRLTEKIA